ncbi:MAG: DUF6048 family protein [Chitinophagaceae bacterium]
MSLKNKWILCCVLIYIVPQVCIGQTKDSMYKKFTYARIGVDMAKLVANVMQNQYATYEFMIDANFKKDINIVSDFGFGHSSVKNSFIEYASRNYFTTFGIDKTFFNKEYFGDMDNVFVSLRYGFAHVKRQDATYAIQDPIWGNVQGVYPSTSFNAHWLEFGSGFKMQVYHHIFLGWNIRFKTLINPKKVQNLAPAYISGYGNGNKNTVFGYNMFLLYGFGKRN